MQCMLCCEYIACMHVWQSCMSYIIDLSSLFFFSLSIKRSRPKELSEWKKAVESPNKTRHYNISITFPEFCRYLVETKSSLLNEHFAPSVDMCQPCRIQYDFYGNFRNYSSDSAQLIKKFKANPNFIEDKSVHTRSDATRLLLPSYYQQLSQQERVQLLNRMHKDLLFYLTLYPSERNLHKKLLGID